MARPPTSFSLKDVDKNSSMAAATPDIRFMAPAKHDFPVITFRCINAIGVIMAKTAKDWLLAQHDTETYGGAEVLRIEEQEVEKVDHEKVGTLLLLEHAAWIQGREGRVPVRILALLMPNDPRVRFWYSAIAPFNSLLTTLDEKRYISSPRTLEPHSQSNHRVIDKNGQTRSDHHCRLYIFLKESFMKALNVPHHPDYLQAISMTNWAPDIDDPGTAIRRIEACEALYNNEKEPKDLSDDRYLLCIHAAERELASQVQVTCAEYLLIKRNFFKDWYTDVFRSDKQVKDGVLARSNYAHEKWLKDVYEFTQRRARRLLTGWRTLGMLDQDKLMYWVNEGGMLAENLKEASQETDSELDAAAPGLGLGAGKTVPRTGRS